MTLYSEFEARGIVRGKTLILPPDAAIAMIARAREVGVRVLGVDGFWITDTTTQPDLGHTLFTGRTAEDVWDEADRFVRERADTGLMFEVVVDEPLDAP